MTRAFLAGALAGVLCAGTLGRAAEDTAAPRLYAIELNGKIGFINAAGAVVVEPQFDRQSGLYAERFHDGLCQVSRDGRIGFIDAEGRVVIEPQFEQAGHFSEGLAPVKASGKWGYIDARGAVMIQFQFNWADEFSSGQAAVRNEQQKWGYIDRSGAVIIDYQFDSAGDCSDGWAAVSIGDRHGFIDRAGSFGTPPPTTAAGGFRDGLAPRSPTGEVSYVSGNKCYDKQRRPMRWGFVDVTGAFRIGAQFDGAGEFAEGLAQVELDGKNGFIDPSGRVVIPLQFDSAWKFAEGLAPVGRDGVFGYINRNGKVVIPLQFDRADLFVDGLAAVYAGDEKGYINPKGEFVWGLQAFQTWGRVREIRFQREAGYHSFMEAEEEIVLRSDGTAEHSGNEKAKRRGRHLGKLRRHEFRRLAELLQSSDFFTMPDEDERGLHAPRIKIVATGEGISHTVERDEDAEPVALWGLTQAIASVADRVEWKRVSAGGGKPR